MISRIFSCKFLHIQIASVSGHSVHFIFKTCQIVADTSMTRQFHEFSNLIFAFGTTVQQQQQLKRFVAKNSFQTKAFKGQQIPSALLKRSLSRTMLYRWSNLPFGSQIFQSITYEKYLGRWMIFLTRRRTAMTTVFIEWEEHRKLK